MSKFWAEDISQLFSSIEMIPKEGQPLVDKLNAITRLSLAISIVIALFKPVLAVSTFSICIVVILVTYFANTEKTVSGFKEGFESGPSCTTSDYSVQYADDLFVAKDSGSLSFPKSVKRFCNDFEPLISNCDYASANQALVGSANPKTFIPPIVAAPSHELSFWKATDLVKHSSINDETNFDAYRSGYEGNSYSGGAISYSGYGVEPEADLPQKCKECHYVPCVCPRSRIDKVLTQTIQPGVYQRSRFDEPINSNIGISLQKQFDPMLISRTPSDVKYTALDPNTPMGSFGVADGFADGFSSESIGPMGPLKGLGRAVEFNSTTLTLDDLLRNRKAQTAMPIDTFQSESNVYDPRFTGYGPTDRGYLDPVTGQPRYFYDDVNAVKMPNFVARSNIDVFPWATQYGTDVGVESGDGYKQLANNAFLDATLQFRTEMQERLLRKRNAEMWQLRVAPISTQNNLGGGSSSYVV